MKAIIFIYEIFKKFPLLLIANIILLIAVSLFSACSLFTISPVVDLAIHPDLQGISPLTSKAIGIIKSFGLPVTLGTWVFIFIILIILSSASQILVKYTILKTGYAVLRDLMFETFEDFFNARWYFFSSNKQGVLLNILTREIIIVNNAFDAMALLFATCFQMIFFLAVPLYISWQVTVISLGVALLFAIPFILLGGHTYRLGILSTTTANQTMSIIQENLSLAKLVLGFGNQHKSMDSFKRSFDTHYRVGLKTQALIHAIPILYRPFGMIMVVIALFVALRLNVPLSEMTVLLLALLQFALSIGQLTTQKNSLENFLPSYEQIKKMKQMAKELKQESGTREFKGFSQELRVEGLTFAYPSQEPVLVDINVRIPKGKMMALVGESGVGKSTFIDMIMGFHKPVKGQVLLDGIPLEDFDIHSYRRRIGYVPQDSVLFNATIKQNLLWAFESAVDGEISQACRRANAEEFIKQLPEGYDTVVGDRGVRLSSGQVQRIALARAILRKPDLLILDEATSSLDTYSERLIQQAIENIARETTVIVIAHRLSTIVNADYIYVLKEGRMVEEGTYSQLIQMNGYFNRMVELQTLETT